MEAIKRAIRSALDRGDAQDRGFREKVYRQAFAALERSMQARPDLSAEDVLERRQRVKELIIEIESEFVPAVAPAASPPSPPAAEPESSAELDFAPRATREDRLSSVADEPVAAAREEMAPVREDAGGPRRLGVLLAAAAVIAAVSIGGWFLFSNGPEPGAARNPQGGAGGVATAPERDIQASENWITVFSPSDPTTVRAGGGTSAQAIEEEGEAFMRIGGGPEARVSFDIGQGVLERLAGGRVVFNLEARAQEGEETQISIACDFGALGDCGRRRYVVGPMQADYLFEMELPDRQPTGGGTITIVPDIEGEGRVLDVFSLQVAAAE